MYSCTSSTVYSCGISVFLHHMGEKAVHHRAVWLLTLAAILVRTVSCEHRLLSPNDPRIQWEGRWIVEDSVASADWPCSGFRVGINVSSGDTATLLWRGVRSRMRIILTHQRSGVVSDEILSSPAVTSPFACNPCSYPLNFTGYGRFTLSVRKLTSADPFGSGIGRMVLKPSVIEFHGLDGHASLTSLEPIQRKIEFVGASDTAGYCVDGTPNQSSIETTLEGVQMISSLRPTP